MTQTVCAGPFLFCTRLQLDGFRIALVGSGPEFTRGLAGASVNGQSFSFYHNGVEFSREEYGWHLLHAYNQLGITQYGIAGGNRTAANFNGGGCCSPNWNC